MAYHFNEDFDTKQDIYISGLVVFWVSESKTFQVLPILIEEDHTRRLVTSDLWNEGIDVVPHARGVCGRDEELCHCLLSITVWNACYATNSCILSELMQMKGLS